MLIESPHLREDVDTLVERLARIDGRRTALRGVADSLHGDEASTTLAGVLDALEPDRTPTARDVDRLHDHAVAGAGR